MQKENFMDGIWESTLFFINPVENYRETKEIFDFPIIREIVGVFFSITMPLVSIVAISFFMIPQGINILLKK